MDTNSPQVTTVNKCREKDSKDFEQFKYSPLPSAHSIRLIEVAPLSTEANESDEDIAFSMIVVDLDDNPKFDALSYTWGLPLSVFENEQAALACQEEFKGSKRAICNGKHLNVSLNLFEALLELRTWKNPDFAAKATAADLPFSRYVWIDAISINQEDISERSAQVAIMGHIYRAASMTVIWLGREDTFSRQAISMLQPLFHVSPEKLPVMRAAHQKLYARNYSAMGLPKFREMDWFCLYAFLQRNWFKRIWILQEVALAGRVAMLCGKILLSWSAVAGASQTLVLSNWWEAISATVTDIINKRSRAQSMSSLGANSERSSFGYEFKGNDIVQPHRNVIGITATRASLGIKDKTLGDTSKQNIPAKDMTELFIFFRDCESTEPKDKIYSLLGMLPKNVDGVPPIIPDYTKSVEEVYIEAAWHQICSRKDLSILGYLQDSSRTQYKNLPSWVPDYSVPLFPNSLSNTPTIKDGKEIDPWCPYTADGNLEFRLPQSPTGPKLSVQGFLFDFIIDEAEFGFNDDLSQVLVLLANLPHLFWNDVEIFLAKTKEERSRYSKDQSSDGAETPSTETLIIQNGYLVSPRSPNSSKLYPFSIPLLQFRALNEI
jgi:heterokaryon incompatibility protein (HET)